MGQWGGREAGVGNYSCKTKQEAGQGTRLPEDKGSSNRKAAAEEAGVREARCAHTDAEGATGQHRDSRQEEPLGTGSDEGSMRTIGGQVL